MTKEEKIERRKLSSKRRAERKMDKYIDKIQRARNIGLYDIPLHAFNPHSGSCGSWADPNSPTGYSQICSYQGICQSPCNGDC